MKKQTHTLTQTQPGRREWILLAVIVAMITKNQSKSSVPTGSLPLNAAKETLMNLISDGEKLVSKLAHLLYTITGESFISVFNLFAFAGLIVSIVMAIYFSSIK